MVVCSQTVWEQVLHRSGAGVLDFDEKPLIVVEIVSSNRRDDYVIKRNEYEMAQIPKYWIIDPKNKLVRVCANPSKEEGYSFDDFTEDRSIVDRQLDQLVLSVKELLDPPLVEELIKEEQLRSFAKQPPLASRPWRPKIKTLEQQAETERQRAETERQHAETERQRAETERQHAETERQRAEKLAQRLLEMGVHPDEIN